MPKPLETTRDFIIERQHDLAQKIVDRQWELRPSLQQRYGKLGHAKCLEDARYHLKYLSEAVGAAEPNPLRGLRHLGQDHAERPQNPG